MNEGAHSCFYQNSFKFLLSNEKVPKLKQVWEKMMRRSDQRHKNNKGQWGGSAEERTCVHLEDSLDLAWQREGGKH